MSRRPVLATAVFVVATVACAATAAVSSTPVGSAVRPVHGDGVVYVVPRRTASCRLGDVATGRVVGLPGDVIATKRVGPAARPRLLVNGGAVATLPPAARAVGAFTVGAGRVFVLGAGECGSLALGTIPRTSLVGYTQGTLGRHVGEIRQQLADRITGEKYVAGVYLLVVASFLAYLLIHAGRLGRLQRELARIDELNERA